MSSGPANLALNSALRKETDTRLHQQRPRDGGAAGAAAANGETFAPPLLSKQT